MHHDLKIDEPYYQAVRKGRKNFEIRFNDRGHQAGDTVRLFVPGTSLPSVWAKIGYVTAFQQRESYVVFSLLDIEVKP